MNAAQYIDALVAQGRNAFTTEQLVGALGVSVPAARAQLKRLKRRGVVASPLRSFHVVVPPEYRRLGCIPAEHFIDALMRVEGEPYYVALLSAAARHGAAHQSPQALQVMVARNRPDIECGAVRITFIARGDLEQMPVVELNTPHGTIRYATPEGTALELMGYPQQAGGLNHVATTLDELAEVMAPEPLLGVARLCPVSWSQRLGYLLQMSGHDGLAAVLKPWVMQHAKSFTPLRRANPVAGATRDPDWKLTVNADVEPDL